VDIIYLEDGERIWPDGSVNFIPVSSFYEALRDVGAEGLVRDFEKLKKGALMVVERQLYLELVPSASRTMVSDGKLNIRGILICQGRRWNGRGLCRQEKRRNLIYGSH
jgi:hypothetical protein